MTRRALHVILSLAVLLGALGCGTPPPPPTPEATAVAGAETSTPAVEATVIATETPIASPTGEPPATGTATAVASRAASATTQATASSTTAPTRTNTPRPSATATETATASPTAPRPTATVTPSPRPKPGRVFLGYYVPYDSTSWQSLVAQAGNLDYVALQVATLDYCGNVSARDDRTLLDFAQGRGLPVLASLFTSSEPLNHSILTNAASTDNAVRQLIDYVVSAGYDGLDIDLESVPAGDRAALTAFVARVSAGLRANGKLVTMAIPAKAREVTTGWAGAYDYAALAPHLDLAIIMAYTYTTSSGGAGSIAPLDWVTRVTAFTASQIPAEKVLMGVGLWGYDWNVTAGGRAKSLRYPQAQALAAANGKNITVDATTRSATFTYIAPAGAALPYQDTTTTVNHEMVERKPPTCPLTPATPTPVPRTPVPTATPAASYQHTVWLENAQTVAERLDMFENYGLGGAAGWRLGHEDPAVWGAIADYRYRR